MEQFPAPCRLWQIPGDGIVLLRMCLGSRCRGNDAPLLPGACGARLTRTVYVLCLLDMTAFDWLLPTTPSF